MAPTRSKKKKSTESINSINVQSFPAPPQMVPTKTRSPARTPSNRSPIKKQRMGITAAQKQALLDNLQLESMLRLRHVKNAADLCLQLRNVRENFERSIWFMHNI
jgi:hypothetical protein